MEVVYNCMCPIENVKDSVVHNIDHPKGLPVGRVIMAALLLELRIRFEETIDDVSLALAESRCTMA